VVEWFVQRARDVVDRQAHEGLAVGDDGTAEHEAKGAGEIGVAAAEGRAGMLGTKAAAAAIAVASLAASGFERGWWS
jgi:hypothetical protein